MVMMSTSPNLAEIPKYKVHARVEQNIPKGPPHRSALVLEVADAGGQEDNTCATRRAETSMDYGLAKVNVNHLTTA